MLNKRTVILLTLLTGVAIEVLISAASGRREAWDSTGYWTIGVPVALVVSFGIGYVSKSADWVWTLLVVPGQFIAMAAKSRDFSMLPLGLILGVFMSVPFLAAAFVGQKLRGTSVTKTRRRGD